MTTKLSVNLNAVAQLRNRRDLPWPDPAALGRIALEAGAAGLTVHPRPDERHIRKSDVPLLRKVVESFGRGAEFNIEGYPSDDFLELVEANRPHQVTLVPDDPAQATSDHGWNLDGDGERLAKVIERLRALGGRVSLFIDPDPSAPAKVARAGADRVELYTGPYGAAHGDAVAAGRALDRLQATAAAARQAGLAVNAGHDLTIDNLPALVARIPFLAEVSIGHALTADALVHGMAATVKRFLKALAGSADDAGRGRVRRVASDE